MTEMMHHLESLSAKWLLVILIVIVFVVWSLKSEDISSFSHPNVDKYQSFLQGLESELQV